ncbi:hypothetical protein HZB60_11635 [candidate division KSB1 bacterium]|nr:hypothetical protein [candidate division KSB1 bacterium]
MKAILFSLLIVWGIVARGQEFSPSAASQAVLDAACQAVLDYYPAELLDPQRVDAAKAVAVAQLALGGLSRTEIETALDEFVRAACDDDQAMALPQTDSIGTAAVLSFRLSRFTLDEEDEGSGYLRIRDWTDPARVTREFAAALDTLRQTRGLLFDLHGFSGDEELWQELAAQLTDLPLHGARLHTRIPGTTFATESYPDIYPGGGRLYCEPIVFWLDRSWQPALAFASIVQARGSVDYCFDQRGLHSRAANLRAIELPLGYRIYLPTATAELAYDVPQLAPADFLADEIGGESIHQAKWLLREMIWWYGAWGAWNR